MYPIVINPFYKYTDLNNQSTNNNNNGEKLTNLQIKISTIGSEPAFFSFSS